MCSGIVDLNMRHHKVSSQIPTASYPVLTRLICMWFASWYRSNQPQKIHIAFSIPLTRPDWFLKFTHSYLISFSPHKISRSQLFRRSMSPSQIMDTSIPSSSTQTIKKPFSILDLPPEIRRIVLRMMLVPPRMLDSYCAEYGEDDEDDTNISHVSWKVRLTCKQLYEEGRHLLYSQNVFHLSSGHPSDRYTRPFLWRSLNSAAEENLAMIQRVAVPCDIHRSLRPWSGATQDIRDLYNPPPGLRAFRPPELIVTDLGLPRYWFDSEEYFLDGYNENVRLNRILKEHDSVWEPAPDGRPLQERWALNERISKIFFHIQALKLRDAIIATLAELQKLDSALMHVYVASAPDNPDESNTGWILIFSSTKRAPYHLSNAFSALVNHLHRELY